MHLIPDGFPLSIPGILEDIERAMQQAPQPERQSISKFGVWSYAFKVSYVKLIEDILTIFAKRNINEN